MSHLPDAPPLQAAVQRLAPYARHKVDEAAGFARRMHAEDFTLEHLLSSMFFDEETAASRVVLHAFADPETLATEVMALCPGITVVGSERCLPFSVRGVRALFAARTAAAGAGAEAVTPVHLLAAAAGELTDEARGKLEATGFEPPVPSADPAGDALEDAGPLFRSFSNDSKRALGVAGNAAVQFERARVSPAHLFLGCLQVDDDLGRAHGTSHGRARMLLAGLDDDPTDLAPAPLAADADLVAFLARLPEDSDTLALLEGVLAHGATELRQLLVRQRITPQLVERSKGAFRDPAPPA